MSVSISKEEFAKKYHEFVDRLPSRESGKYLRLFTESRQRPFKVFKNSSNSIVVEPFTNDASQMVVSLNQLTKVVYEDAPNLYKSYEPVLIKKIIELVKSDFSTLGEIVQETDETMKKILMNNIILYGPPGVGKTYNYKKIVTMIESGSYDQKRLFDAIVKNDEVTDIDIDNDFKRIKDEDRVEFVTFHQSFSYEDFIEGFRPNEEGKIKLDDGVFKRLAEKADENPAKKFYLVIDEINRGNISKIFGELITLIEEDKRDVIEVTLPYSKEPFSVPSNLYIIATMNSTDKSIALIDIALRRRFTFLKMQPDVRLVKEEAKTLFEKLNAFISEKLGADFQIGHSYFMDYDNLGFVIDYKIVPLLEEYFFADPEGLSQARAILGKSGN